MSSRAITTTVVLPAALFLFFVCGGCESCGSKQTPAAKAPSEKTAESPPAAQPAPGQPEGKQVPAGPPPRVEIAATPDPATRRVTIAVRNRHAEPVNLKSAVIIERAAEGGWQRFPAEDIGLRFSCDDRLESCIKLVPGAELLPPAWRAAGSKAQCGADAGDPAPAGRYRFVVTGCDRPYRLASAPFELSAVPGQPAPGNWPVPDSK